VSLGCLLSVFKKNFILKQTPYYCAPLVCLVNFSRGLAVWRLQLQTNKQGPGQSFESCVINWVHTTRLVQYIIWLFATQERKKERLIGCTRNNVHSRFLFVKIRTNTAARRRADRWPQLTSSVVQLPSCKVCFSNTTPHHLRATTDHSVRHTYICAHTYIHTYTLTHLYTCTLTQVHTYTYTYIRTYARTHKHVTLKAFRQLNECLARGQLDTLSWD